MIRTWLNTSYYVAAKLFLNLVKYSILVLRSALKARLGARRVEARAKTHPPSQAKRTTRGEARRVLLPPLGDAQRGPRLSGRGAEMSILVVFKEEDDENLKLNVTLAFNHTF